MRRRVWLCAAALFGGGAAPGVPPIPQVLSETSLGTVTQNPQIDGRDGTYSTLINGKSYWTFGDTTLQSDNASGENFFDNSLSWSSSLDASAGIVLDHDQSDSSGLPARFIPFTKSETEYNETHATAHCTASPCGANLALWPGPIVADPVSGEVVVPFDEIWRVPTQSGWRTVGAGLAIGKILADGTLSLTRPVQNPGSQTPTLMWGKQDIAFIDVSFLQKGWYYAYGDHRMGLVHHFLLGRVPIAQVLQHSAWQYYAGNGAWSGDVANGISVFDGGAAGNSVFYDRYLGEWMAIYTAPLSNTMYYRVASAPEGPWSRPTQLLVGLPGWHGNVDYAGRAHPEFSPDGGRTILVAYARTTGFLHQDLPQTQIVFGPGD